jgi:hypothetical protein
MALVLISIYGPIWQASDATSPKATESAHRAFLKFALEPRFVVVSTRTNRLLLADHGKFLAWLEPRL